ncbi:flavodoxin family protein [Halobacillus shinanisalinarum]|uniref:Flavodoxin family protein n=1 Tax=Halobacillus shinanisalinarum TaxID=2932258 RepID=A0ABY4H5E2_9BACI|nr:flavodoxin family protein [Halobacillus shinanisalinarum]
MKAVILNASLKQSDEPSNTAELIKKITDIFTKEKVEYEMVRLADYNIKYGISDNLGKGDEWPEIFRKIKEANILILGTPLWLGEKSSLATLAIERIYGGAGITNDKGQSIYYNKVGGVVVTGNEDGAKTAARSVLYALSHVGFVIPPNVDTYWLGEAGPGPSYMEADGGTNEFTDSHATMEAYNLIHLARMLKDHPIPPQGNVVDS